MSFGWLLLAFIYLAFLFSIAKWGDKNTPTSRWLTSHPIIYSLALGIYCTAWTFFGAVGQASQGTWIYLPILLGPAVMYLFFNRFIYKLIFVSKKQHISTIADFISARYGKRQVVALLVTIIALLATVPYIALQLKAIGSIFEFVSEQNNQLIVIVATLFVAIFSMYFGTRKTDVTEYRRGLMLAISFESIVKLGALVLVAIIAYSYWLQGPRSDIVSQYVTEDALSTFFSFSFWAQTLMAAAAVICLPRQFHVAVIDNLSLEHLKTARWVFPLYLAVIALTIPIIAAAGNVIFLESDVKPDNYVLALANLGGSVILKVIVFFGGLSAAIAMIIVATLTLSTMLANDVILPRIIKRESDDPVNKIIRIKIIRRIVILAILALAFMYQQQMTNQASLASIGLIAFSLVIQLLPSIVGGLYWKKGHAHGVYAGLISGVIIWALWLILPHWGLFNVIDTATESISYAAIMSLIANIFAYLVFSIRSKPRLIDRIQAEAFVSPLVDKSVLPEKLDISVVVGDLHTLISRFTGQKRCNQLFDNYSRQRGYEIAHNQAVDKAFLVFCERALGGVVGASSAKVLIDSVVIGKKLDITEVVNFVDDTTEAIQFNLSALSTSLENIEQGISVVDKHLNLVAWNNKYLTIFNFPKELVQVGTPIEELIRFHVERCNYPAEELELQIEKRLEPLRHPVPHKFVRRRENGSVIEMNGKPLPEGGFVTSFHDITGHFEVQQALEESNEDLENKIRRRTEEIHSVNAALRLEIERRNEAEKELIRARKEAEDANASKTRFLALASHDVLQPLNASKLYLSALQEENLAQDTRMIVTKLSDSVASSEALISTILDISRLDQGELKPFIEAINVKEVITPIINEMSMKAIEKGLNFTHSVEDVWISADKTYLYRVIQNFVSNAVKYTHHGKVVLSVFKQQDKINIQVKDTGIGIPQIQQTAIFSDFYRVENNNEQGIGLGLGVVKRLTAQLNCKVEVCSTEGEGSSFTIIFDEVTAPQKPKQADKLSSSIFSGLRVLCIDDQRVNTDAMYTLLSKWGIKVSTALSYDDALQQARQFKPQILLVDYQLGKGKNGLEIIDSIRQQSNAILPACLITAKQDDSLVEECRSLGVHYMNKPVKPAKLRTLIQNMTKYIKYARSENKT